MNAYSNSDVSAFYFNANISDSLLLEKIELRSCQEYDNDIYAEKTALSYIEKIANCFDGNIYLLTASQDVSPTKKIRSKKGVLWNEKQLCKLECYSSEVEVVNGKTRLVSLVQLKEFNYDSAEAIVLNWVFSFILLTNLDVKSFVGLIEGWVAKGENSVLAFDYDAVAKDLSDLGTTSVLRYFPADNSRGEALVVVGNRKFVEDKVQNCIRCIDLTGRTP